MPVKRAGYRPQVSTDVESEMAAIFGKRANGTSAVTQEMRASLKPANGNGHSAGRPDVWTAGAGGIEQLLQEQQQDEQRRIEEKDQEARRDYERFLAERQQQGRRPVPESPEFEPDEDEDEPEPVPVPRKRQAVIDAATFLKNEGLRHPGNPGNPVPQAAQQAQQAQAPRHEPRAVSVEDQDRLWDWIRAERLPNGDFFGVPCRTTKELHGLVSQALAAEHQGTAFLRALYYNGSHYGFLLLMPISLPDHVASLHIFVVPQARGHFHLLFPQILTWAQAVAPGCSLAIAAPTSRQEPFARMFEQYGFVARTILVREPGPLTPTR